MKELKGNLEFSKKWYISFLIVLFFIHLSMLIAFTFLGDFWTDENWYFSCSSLVAKGLLPYKDFFFHHNPLFLFVYAVPQYFWGPNFVLARLTSVFFSIVIFVLTVRLASKFGGKFGGVFAASILSINPYYCFKLSQIAYHPLQTTIVMLFFTFLFSKLKDSIKYPFSAFLLGLIVCIRFTTDYVSILFLAFLSFIIVKYRSQKIIAIGSFLAGIIPILVFYLLALYYAKDRFIFDTITYSLKLPNFFKSFGVFTDYDFVFPRPLIVKLRSFAVIIENFYASFMLLFMVLFYHLKNFRLNKKFLKDFLKQNTMLIVGLIFIFSNFVFYLIPSQISAVFYTFTFPLFAVLIGIGTKDIIFRMRDKDARNVLCFMVVLILVFSIFIGGREVVVKRWENSDVRFMIKAAKRIQSISKRDEQIFSFSPALVTLANRNIALNLTMEVWMVFPPWDTAKSKKLGIVNIEMIQDALNNQKPELLVFQRPGRLEDDGGAGRLLKNYRESLMRAIANNYSLIETIYRNSFYKADKIEIYRSNKTLMR